CPLGPTVRLTARPPERLFHLVLESHDGRAPSADSEEKHEPASDIDTVVVDSLKALDPEWPIREADKARRFMSTGPSRRADQVLRPGGRMPSQAARPGHAGDYPRQGRPGPRLPLRTGA